MGLKTLILWLILAFSGNLKTLEAASTNFYNYRPSDYTDYTASPSPQPFPFRERPDPIQISQFMHHRDQMELSPVRETIASSPIRVHNQPQDLRLFNNRKRYGNKYLEGQSSNIHTSYPSRPAFPSALTSRDYVPDGIPSSGGRGHQFMETNEDDGTYHWGYDTGPSYLRHGKSFREERRDSYGRVWGKYGYVDPEGTLQVVEYVADEGGYRTRTRSRHYFDSPTNPQLVGPLPNRNRPPGFGRGRASLVRRPRPIYSDEEED